MAVDYPADMMNAVAVVAQDLERFIDRLNQFETAALRRQAARNMLKVLSDWDSLCRNMLETTVGGLMPPPLPPVMSASFLDNQTILAEPFAQELVRVAETGGYVAKADVLPWIGTTLLIILAVAALFFGLPVVALIATLGAAVVAALAALNSLATTAGTSAGGAVVASSATLGIVLIAGLIIFLFYRRRIKNNAS